MTNLDGGSLVLQAATWPSRHSRVVAFGWGLFSGYTFGPLIVGSAVVGYLIGKSGGGRRTLAIASLGMLAGFAITMTFLVTSMVNSGCPSCVDALIVAPGAFLFLLAPLAFGYWLSRRSTRPAAQRAVATGDVVAETDRADAVPSRWREAGWLSGAVSVPGLFVIAFVSARAGVPQVTYLIFLLTAIAIVRIIGTKVGLRGRRDWILACAYCVGFGWLVAAFLIQIWYFVGCPVFAQQC
jgi:hypothetical protein